MLRWMDSVLNKDSRATSVDFVVNSEHIKYNPSKILPALSQE